MNKYRARRTTIHGKTFASQKEARRYLELLSEEERGEIKNLELKPRFPLIVNGQRIGYYEADFRYLRAGREVVEDVKGFRTPVYRLKSKLIRALYGIEIVEV